MQDVVELRMCWVWRQGLFERVVVGLLAPGLGLGFEEIEEIYLGGFSAAKVVIFGLLWEFLLFVSLRFLYETQCSSALWPGPSRAVHVEISAVLCKSTLIPLIWIFTCLITKGSAKWLDFKCFAVKHQAYNMVTPLSGCSGDFVCMGHWRLHVQAGKCERCCSAWQKEIGALHFPAKWQFWLCPTGCSRWWVIYFVGWIKADSTS